MIGDCLEVMTYGLSIYAYNLSNQSGILKCGLGKTYPVRDDSYDSKKSEIPEKNSLLDKFIRRLTVSVIAYRKKLLIHFKNAMLKILRRLYPFFNGLIIKDKKTILFISFHGRGYSDNPKALHEYMLENSEFNDFKFVWAIKGCKKKNLDIPNAKQIEYAGLKYLYYLARSKYWISNCKLPAYVYKSKNQVYLQTWHGTPLKRLAHDIIVPEDTTFYRSEISFKEMAATYDNDVSKYNFMISPSAFTTEVFQSAFAINRERLIETGYPRNDCLSNYKEEELDQLKDKYGIPKGKKVVLYAPTWRDNSYNLKGYTFKLEVDFSKWQEILGDEYVVIFKPHYLIISDFDVNAYQGFVYSIDATEDISRLYIVSDILITDYSSVFFDYAILERPIYFYMYDLESYRSELRGFYIDIYKDLPGDIFESEIKMLKDIRDEKYDYNRLEEFNKRFNNCEDGNASKRVIDILMEGK
ncbi:CDP-glycerol glycerophosphotransferase family protein [Tannockella kyphosi]|uniref:CDP-glycerol glycerophosphotransferase family protein n=1 Tax=Tannockella kyphosi TaxID=2899121 RepID=UPI00296232DC|nr:CDP-glycerol glycerophosphotransferase family protein [Tannockella kyphosi]